MLRGRVKIGISWVFFHTHRRGWGSGGLHLSNSSCVQGRVRRDLQVLTFWCAGAKVFLFVDLSSTCILTKTRETKVPRHPGMSSLHLRIDLLELFSWTQKYTLRLAPFNLRQRSERNLRGKVVRAKRTRHSSEEKRSRFRLFLSKVSNLCFCAQATLTQCQRTNCIAGVGDS